MKDIDKFRGCLIGGAAGDALGYAVEFLDEETIFSRYGENGITGYDLVNGVAEISDDTQMTLFTANGLLLGTTRGMTRGIMGSYPSYIAFCYKDWLRTQCEKYPLNEEYPYSWLINIPELYNRRAPGNTCLTAIENGANGTIDEPINRSKGCGGVMRVAPIGLYFETKRRTIDEIDMIGAETAAITHGHELGYIPAAGLVHIVQSLSHNEDISLLDAVLDMLSDCGYIKLLNQAPDDANDIARLLHISDEEKRYIENAEVGSGLLIADKVVVPFNNTFPQDTELFRLMDTNPNSSKQKAPIKSL